MTGINDGEPNSTDIQVGTIQVDTDRGTVLIPEVSAGSKLIDSVVYDQPEAGLKTAGIEQGDEIVVDFNPTHLEKNQFREHPQLSVVISKPATGDEFAEGLASGGPELWEEAKIRLVGTRLDPDRSAASIGTIKPQGHLEVLVFNDDLGGRKFAEYLRTGKIVDDGGHLFTKEQQTHFGWNDDRVRSNLSWETVIMPQVAQVVHSKPTPIQPK